MAALSLEGQTIGKYQVLEPLGSGGMARVYRAYHPQLNRYVAIKVLRPDLLEDDAFNGRFHREAQAVAALRHPNIVQVYDFDTQDDLTYMIMELLPGDTLHARLSQYRIRSEHMPYGEMVRILLDLLAGLDYAHQQGMIHRDIKPANILLTQQGQAVLADFGIAQIVGGTRHTVSGALLGTLNYMAPEQGLQNISDVRSDLYSVGVVFYEMLTRQPPYEAETPLAILLKHVNDPLPLPRDLNPEMPAPFEQVIFKALAKQPDDRYQTAVAMSTALQEASQQAGLTIPSHISLPMSFSTPAAPAESVSVYSGSIRAKLTDKQFAAEETTATLGAATFGAADLPSYTAHLAALKAAEVEAEVPEKMASPPLVPADEQELQTKPGNPGAAAVKGFAVFVTINLLMVMFSGRSGTGALYPLVWPVEFLLFGGWMALIMYQARNMWLFIPAGWATGLGILFGYYTFSNNWDYWSFLWPLLIFMLGGILWIAIAASKKGERARALSGDWAVVTAIFAYFFTFVFVVWGLIRI